MSSWESVSQWYGALVGEKGHYYHEKVIFPKLKSLMNWRVEDPALLDLACGSGPLTQILPKGATYTGIDVAPSLIAKAKKRKLPHASWLVGDITKPLDLPKEHFSHAAIILALQNVDDPGSVLKNAAKHLRPGGRFHIVLNHPAFRIPRQSEWHIDEKRNLQQRCMSSYMSSMEIPIQTQGESVPAFHFPLHELSRHLASAGFVIERLDEWCSDKKSIGKTAKRENRARREFPLFLHVVALKKSL